MSGDYTINPKYAVIPPNKGGNETLHAVEFEPDGLGVKVSIAFPVESQARHMQKFLELSKPQVIVVPL